MKNKPKVSIALRSYNQKDFLVECINTIVAQSYSNIEIIIADDASNDGSQKLIKKYQQKYPNKIKAIFQNENIGHTKNLNIALKACTGEYISIFDGDDLMHAEKISKQVDYMETHPNCIVCYHNTEFFDNESGKLLYLRNNKDNAHCGNVSTMIKYGMFNTNIASMIRKSAIPLHGADERISIASDWIFYVECLMPGGTIEYIDQPLARVRRHSNNITQKKFLKNIIDQYLSSLLIMKKYPKFILHIFFRWFDGLRNMFFITLLKKY